MRRQRLPGQSLVLVALVLPVLIGGWLLTIELTGRLATARAATAALRAANRAAVQTFDYRAFAADRLAIADPAAVVAIARSLATINLQSIAGLREPPADVAASIRWTVLPSGGSCVLEPGRPPLRFPAPALCGIAELELVSPLGLRWATRIYAADTLDQSPLSAQD